MPYSGSKNWTGSTANTSAMPLRESLREMVTRRTEVRQILGRERRAFARIAGRNPGASQSPARKNWAISAAPSELFSPMISTTKRPPPRNFWRIPKLRDLIPALLEQYSRGRFLHAPVDRRQPCGAWRKKRESRQGFSSMRCESASQDRALRPAYSKLCRCSAAEGQWTRMQRLSTYLRITN